LEERYLSFFNGSYHRRPVPSRSNTGYIEEETKHETSVLALSLFSNSLSTGAKPIEYWLHWRRNKARNFSFSLDTLL